MTGIIDYGSGNLRSVFNAFRYLGEDVTIADSPGTLKGVDKIVLPGVGASCDALNGLKERELVGPIFDHIKKGKPFLGICLGLQLLFEKSEENGGCECLKFVQGEVKRFPQGRVGLKVPQIGWNTVKITAGKCPVLKGIQDGSFFYFVHSYYCDNREKGGTAGVTEYGVEYTSVFWKENVCAVQFHPERSQKNGLKLLENFVRL